MYGTLLTTCIFRTNDPLHELSPLDLTVKLNKHFMISKAFLHCTPAAAQYIVIGPVCGWVDVCVCGSVTTINRNCVHRSSANLVCR